MRYLVKEAFEGSSAIPVEGKVFKTISAALQFVKKSNKGKKVLFGDREATENDLAGLLRQRLSTVTLFIEKEPGKKFAITAFEDVKSD